MKYENNNQINFFLEMSERQINTNEFFSSILLHSLDRNFGLKNILISYFDKNGKFLSWANHEGILLDNENHVYRKFISRDKIREIIYKEAVKDNLTYFNLIPRLYKSTDLIDKNYYTDPIDKNHCTDLIDINSYKDSEYVEFIEQNFNAHYSATMAFGINGYIQVTFFKSFEEGDFTDIEKDMLNKIYVYIANCYSNFKKHEHSKIISNIQSKIISSGEKAYLIVDEFMHVMNYNEVAKGYLSDILGKSIEEDLSSTNSCNWLYLLLGNDIVDTQTRSIKEYIFKINTYNQTYSNGIIDKYYWITISKKEELSYHKNIETSNKNQINDLIDNNDKHLNNCVNKLLTNSEQKIASLIYKGFTYKEIAKELVVSYHTVKKHIENIYSKCGVKSRFELSKWLENNKKS